jgi:hypothetical protein
MRFVSSCHNGSVTHSFIDRRVWRTQLLLERHKGPCTCSFCGGYGVGYLRSYALRFTSGWNIISFATPWSRWYLRWFQWKQ